MRFSIVVPFLNEEEHIRHCLECLRQQDFDKSEYEIIFVDNASTDSSPEIVKEFSDVICLYEERRDPYLARNVGIQAARGEIIVFTDADCVVETGWLKAFDSAFSDPALQIAVGRLCFPKDSAKLVKYYQDYYATKIRMIADTLPRETAYGHAGNMAIRKSLFDSLGLFLPMPIVGDSEIVQRYFEHYPNDRMKYLHDAVATHMEVKTNLELLKKLYAYGLYSETLSQHGNFRVSNIKEKLMTFSKCVVEYKYSLPKQIALFVSLVTHYVAFSVGCLKARLSFSGK